MENNEYFKGWKDWCFNHKKYKFVTGKRTTMNLYDVLLRRIKMNNFTTKQEIKDYLDNVVLIRKDGTRKLTDEEKRWFLGE